MEKSTEVPEVPEVVATEVEVPEVVATVATVATEVPEVEEPPTPSHKRTVVVEDQRPVPQLDADFWSGMLLTKRNMDKEAKSLRYSNLAVFK